MKITGHHGHAIDVNDPVTLRRQFDGPHDNIVVWWLAISKHTTPIGEIDEYEISESPSVRSRALVPTPEQAQAEIKARHKLVTTLRQRGFVLPYNAWYGTDT